ncbi:hypothetical protein BBJ28_00008500 [Nothophytophthora sp. Chile5]|nr:hypothetical protein BBJ28_00008500 [Nothophytophthora sp. Chile5]
MATSSKHALIVGASSGIGLAVAQQVAPFVTKLTLCSRSCPTDLVASIKAKNPDVEVVHEYLDMDLMAQSLSEHAPLASFMHIDPGFVRTAYFDNAAWYMRLPMKAIAAVLADSPEKVAQVILKTLTAEEYAVGWKLLDKRAEEVPKTKFHTEELKDAVWEHTLQTIDNVLKQ